MTQETFWSHHEVRYGDIDRNGHLNNVQVLAFFEQSRTSFFDQLSREVGRQSVVDGLGILIARLDCTYHEAVDARPRTLRVRTRVARLGRTSVTFDYALFNGARCTATSRTVAVMVEHGAPREIATDERRFLTRYLHPLADPEVLDKHGQESA